MMQRPSIERIDPTTPDLTTDRLNALRELIPEAFSEGKVDFDKLRAALGDVVDDRPERYSFTWAGKRDAIRLLQTPSSATLVPAPEESVNWDTTQHLFIEGDNLEVLKLLYKAYFGKVKLIYIDPPYNTGNDFVYPDDFADPLGRYLEITGQKDAAGNLLTSNPETSGRYHSAWLNMMYPRLFMARQLLQDNGVIFVSIDDHEVANLRFLLNEIFGEENFLAEIVWQKIYSGKADANYLGRFHEYILCYARNLEYVDVKLLARTEEMNARYKNPDNDPRGPWLSNDLTASGERSGGHYEVVSPTGQMFDSPQGKHWLYARLTMQKLLDENRIWFGANGDAFPRLKRFLSEVQQGRKANTLWLHNEVGHTDEARKEIKRIFGDARMFDTPKPSRLIKQILRLTTENDDICLDFFAGSATMADAVLRVNEEDGASRRFIMVQLPEPTSDRNYRTISEIGKERVRRILIEIDDQKKNQLALDNHKRSNLGFRVYKLAPSTIRDWRGTADPTPDDYVAQMDLLREPLVDGWRPEDVVWEIAIKEGFPLTSRVTNAAAAGQLVYRVEDPDSGRAFHACLDDTVSADVAAALGLNQGDLLVVRDSAVDDTAAANLALQCRLKTL